MHLCNYTTYTTVSREPCFGMSAGLLLARWEVGQGSGKGKGKGKAKGQGEGVMQAPH